MKHKTEFSTSQWTQCVSITKIKLGK